MFVSLQGRDLPQPMLAQAFRPEVIARSAAQGPATAHSLTRAAISLALDPYFLDSPATAPQEVRR